MKMQIHSRTVGGANGTAAVSLITAVHKALKHYLPTEVRGKENATEFFLKTVSSLQRYKSLPIYGRSTSASLDRRTHSSS